MSAVAQRTRSLWMERIPPLEAPLAENLAVDVAVIGAGIVGISTAFHLQRAGRSVLLLDCGPPGGGMTGRTTGHLASALDDRWSDLIELRGIDDARLAAAAHAGAIDVIERLQTEEGIACDFTRVDGYLFLAHGDPPDILEHEIEAAHRVGLSEVRWADRAPLPRLDTGRCLRFPGQARFHPLSYLQGLLTAFKRDGGRCHTARVLSVRDGQPAQVETELGWRIDAGAVVVATNTPINDRVAVHTKQAPYRTYVVAGPVTAGSVVDALCWDTADPYHYVRLQPGENGQDWLIIGGEDHKTGQADDMDDRFLRLATWGRERYPALERITHRWSGQVMESIDYLGFAGRNPGDQHVYIATGDSGMGLTHGTIAALVISDAILGRAHPWARLFDPGRITPSAARTYARENLNVAAQFTSYVLAGEVASADDIQSGSGAVIQRGLRKVAAYRDEQGVLHQRSAVCPHLGCLVAWNPAEGCWDCPCHGSQFATDGTVLNGPAVKPLAPSEPADTRSDGERETVRHG